MYYPEQIPRLNGVEFVKRHPEGFFRAGHFNPLELAMMILMDAVILGATKVRLSIDDDWYICCADVDWLQSIPESFDRLLAFPEAGQSSFHAEFLAKVFCESVYTLTRESEKIVKGSSPGAPLGIRPPWERIVAFRS
ncbi:hypothetical protein [Actinocatenispora comari]|uniref:Uncharacterized protein n=1 Tax=Actinocatenispora comari TaxID=2807577 RepID=A0A8J4AH16_9ACTN|nr:hypothetical protein [Actinocatenispora comari]GIL29087.1 hypothetical protein NUM_43410 [Actinocatenispora comari]